MVHLYGTIYFLNDRGITTDNSGGFRACTILRISELQPQTGLPIDAGRKSICNNGRSSSNLSGDTRSTR